MRFNFQDVLLTTLSFLLLPSVTLAQRDQLRVLVIDGHPGHADVIQKDGRAYVDLQSLAELTNGSLTFKESRIILSIRGTDMGRPAADAPADPVHSPANRQLLRRQTDKPFSCSLMNLRPCVNGVTNSSRRRSLWTQRNTPYPLTRYGMRHYLRRS